MKQRQWVFPLSNVLGAQALRKALVLERGGAKGKSKAIPSVGTVPADMLTALPATTSILQRIIPVQGRKWSRGCRRVGMANFVPHQFRVFPVLG